MFPPRAHQHADIPAQRLRRDLGARGLLPHLFDEGVADARRHARAAAGLKPARHEQRRRGNARADDKSTT